MLKTAAQKFYQYLESEKRYSPHTISAYQRDIKTFIEYCQSLELNSFDQLDNFQVRQFVAQQHRKGLGGKSLQRRLSSIRSLYQFLLRQGLVSQNPASGVRAPKSQRKLPEVVNVDQLDQLLNIKDQGTLAVRDLAVMELLYGCGLRLSEIVSLDMPAIDRKQQLIDVTGKGGKQRLLPYGNKAKQALENWFAIRGQLAKASENAVFVSSRGTRLKQRSIQQRLKKWALEQGIDSNLYPHKLRHSFASHILESSGDLRAVQELLGHANLSTTQIYTHLDFQHLAKVYDDAHPRAKLKK